VTKALWFRRSVSEMRRQVERLVDSRRFDVMLVSGSDLHAVYDGLAGVPLVVDWCDAASLRFRLALRHTPAVEWPWRFFQYRRARRIEARLLRTLPHVTFVSRRDRDAACADVHRSVVIPNGCDLTYWACRRSRRGCRIVFTGVMDYPPNADAARHLLVRITPLVRRQMPHLEVVIAGRNPPRDLLDLARGECGVEVTGSVPDLRPYLEGADVFVAPLRFASGMQNKILEAMAMELPVVTTPVAADGIRVDHHEPPLLVGEAPEDLAAHITALLRDPAAATRLGAEGRRYVESHCNWDRSAEALDRLCREAAATAASAPGCAPSTKGGSPRPGVTPAPGQRGPETNPVDESSEPIRGSSLLIVGRLLSLGVMCAVQVLIVRHLSRVDYGAWTLALSVVTLLQGVAALGLDRSISRFVAIYREEGDQARLRGVILLLVTVVAVSGTGLAAVLSAFPSELAWFTRLDPEVVALLGIVIFLVPLEALDLFFIALFACLGQTRVIVLRRHVLAPALKLAVVVVLVAVGADVTFLAWGYLASSLVGLLLYTPLVARALRQLGLGRPGGAPAGVRIPARDVFAFTLPLLTADVASAVMANTGALALGVWSTLDQVAIFTVAVPLAALNQTVARNFTVMYTPAMSRLFARQQPDAIDAMYWRTAAWVAVLTFPVFVVTCSAAGALLHLLYGVKYLEAAGLLSLLAVGEYVNVAFGLSGLTLRLLNHVRYSVAINLVAAGAAVLACVLLVPRFGALGAAVATSGTMIVHGVLKQVGLAAAGVRPFELRVAPLYVAIGVATVAVLMAQSVLPRQSTVPLVLAAAVSLALVLTSRHTLRVAETFPEVRRVPLLRALFA
jgi:O-antigen/teichoic acid export membrane protein/glycosyltransferase involved in cell wall biosynthesis